MKLNSNTFCPKHFSLTTLSNNLQCNVSAKASVYKIVLVFTTCRIKNIKVLITHTTKQQVLKGGRYHFSEELKQDGN